MQGHCEACGFPDQPLTKMSYSDDYGVGSMMICPVCEDFGHLRYEYHDDIVVIDDGGQISGRGTLVERKLVPIATDEDLALRAQQSGGPLAPDEECAIWLGLDGGHAGTVFYHSDCCRKEHHLYPPKVCYGDGQVVDYNLYVETKATKKVGDKLVHSNAAPGYGHLVYEITRIDDTGVYAIVVEDTSGILSPHDVR